MKKNELDNGGCAEYIDDEGEIKLYAGEATSVYLTKSDVEKKLAMFGPENTLCTNCNEITETYSLGEQCQNCHY